MANELRAPRPGKTYAWSLEADTLGRSPAHASVFGGTWTVEADSADSASARFIRQSQDDDGLVFHYLGFTRPILEDFDLSARFRILSGEIDPTAGLLFQMDPKGRNGYLVRASGRTNELVFHYFLSGKRRDVRMAKIAPLTPGTWHTISLSRRKSVLRVSFDGTERMMVRDERYSRGTVGLWTEDDTVVDFADLTATAR
ncbi:MAG: hypothetical protein HY568_06215 [Candidatus Latescibacteria bacterium]|nr:hypothetical protein [Candidatus Latescibacterota bacterium]